MSVNKLVPNAVFQVQANVIPDRGRWSGISAQGSIGAAGGYELMSAAGISLGFLGGAEQAGDFSTQASVGDVTLRSENNNLILGAGTFDEQGNVIGAGNVATRLTINNHGDITIGNNLDIGSVPDIGPKLFFGGNTGHNTDVIYFQRYANSLDQTDFRLVIGDNAPALNWTDSEDDRFEVGALGFPSTDFVPRLTVMSSGQVGINQHNPNAELDVSGNIRATQTVQSWSDIRVKKNIVEIPDALAKIQQIRGVTFDWRRDEFPDRKFKETRDMGVIAQEVEKVFPEVVSTDREGFKSVAYPSLVAPLIEAVKQLAGKIVDVVARVLNLENQSAQSQAQIAQLQKANAEQKRQIQALQSYLCAKDPAASVCH
jgi:hypothetical protein